MRNDSSGNDPKTVWQNQPAEKSIMTSEQISRKTQELQAKTRRTLINGILVSLSIFGIAAYGITSFDGPVVRGVFALAIVWSLAGHYFIDRGTWSTALPGGVISSTGLEAYRQEVERRRHLTGHYLMWSFGPVVLALAAFVVPLLHIAIQQGVLRNTIPFLVLLVMWAGGVFVTRTRDRQALQREIEELNNIEGANG